MLTINLQDPNSPGGLRARRIVSRQKACKNFYWKNREKIRTRERANQPRNTKYIWEWSLKNEYGISVEIFDQMLVEQSGRCKICSIPLKRFHVDHDHASGKVRGLLCGPCNMTLGLVKESVPTLQGMIQYLEQA